MKNQSISENLIYQRKLKGYTQEDLSEKTSVGVRTIQRIEKGDVQPHLQTIKLLAIGLEINVDDLIILENPLSTQVYGEYDQVFNTLKEEIKKSFENALTKSKQEAYSFETAENLAAESENEYLTKAQIEKKIRDTRKAMEKSAKELDFLMAAKLRDNIKSLQKQLEEIQA